MQLRMHDIDLRPDALFTREMTQDFLASGYILFESVQMKKDGTHVPVEIGCRITEYFGMSAVMSTVSRYLSPLYVLDLRDYSKRFFLPFLMDYPPDFLRTLIQEILSGLTNLFNFVNKDNVVLGILKEEMC